MRSTSRVALAATLTLIFADQSAALAASAPPAANAAPANVHVNLATLDFTRGERPDGKHYMSTGPAQAYDKKSHDVSWYSRDTVMGRRVPTLHYGAHNFPTYSAGPEAPGSRGTFWTPAFPIAPQSACTVSFVHSYALGDASRVRAGVDMMTFSYSFDGQNWVDTALPKPGIKLPWTTVTKSIPCQGHTALWLSWDFSTVDGEHNNGRGWNLKTFDLTQP